MEQRIFSLIPGILLALGALAGLVKMERPVGGGVGESVALKTGWWMSVASLVTVYGVTATLAWGWRAGLVWILAGGAMMLAWLDEFSSLPLGTRFAGLGLQCGRRRGAVASDFP